MPLFGSKKKKPDPVAVVEQGGATKPSEQQMQPSPPVPVAIVEQGSQRPTPMEPVEMLQPTEEEEEEIDELAEEYGEILLAEDSASSLVSRLSEISSVNWDPDAHHLFGGFESETSWGDSGSEGENAAFEVGYDPNQLGQIEAWLMTVSGANPALFRNADYIHRTKFIQPLSEEEIFSDLAVGLDHEEVKEWMKEPQPEDFEVQYVTEWSDCLIAQQVVPEFKTTRKVEWPADFPALPHVHCRHFGWQIGMKDVYAPPVEIDEQKVASKMVVLSKKEGQSKVSRKSLRSKRSEPSKIAEKSKLEQSTLSKKKVNESTVIKKKPEEGKSKKGESTVSKKKTEESKKGEKGAAESEISSQKNESRKGARKKPSN